MSWQRAPYLRRASLWCLPCLPDVAHYVPRALFGRRVERFPRPSPARIYRDDYPLVDRPPPPRPPALQMLPPQRVRPRPRDGRHLSRERPRTA